MLSLQSDDELFHIHLYTWMMGANMSDRLVEVSVYNVCSLCAYVRVSV